MDEGSAIQDYLWEKTKQRSVPNIFISTSCSFVHPIYVKSIELVPLNLAFSVFVLTSVYPQTRSTSVDATQSSH